ncbi:MAG: CIA30 family protein [Bacteroidota bacterium]|nr:CIA30 family protein [Bacteroidota bacterium]
MAHLSFSRWTLITMALVLITGCGPRRESIPMIDGRVDDFEDGDIYNYLGFTWESVSGGAEADATIFVEAGGINDSRYQLTIGGMRPTGSAGDLVSGARVLMGQALEANRSEVTNVTAYRGMELRMRGTPGSYIIQLGTEAVEDFDYYNAYVEVTPDWALFRIPFEDFQQEGFGESQRWTGSDLTHIAIYSNRFGPYTVAADDIQFYN